MTYSEDIKRLRRESKMKQYELAKIAGLSREHLSNIETGKADARISSLTDIARALGKRLYVAFIDKD